MRVRKRTSLGLLPALLLLVGSWGCAPRLAPVVPPGVTLQPGRYIAAVYRSPDFSPAGVTYAVAPFTVATARGVDPGALQNILQEELTRAMEANGLKLAPQGEAHLSGTVQQADLRGTSIRVITGKICADLVASGTIQYQDRTLFAFQDRIHLTSPVNPGPPAPRESELLLRQVARTLAVHLLNELLIYWPPAEGK